MPSTPLLTSRQSFLGMKIKDTSSLLSLVSNSNQTKSTTPTSASPNNPTQRLWNMKWLAILVAPLLFGTIILPLITSAIIRWTVRSYVRLLAFWRLGFAFLGFGYVYTYYFAASVGYGDDYYDNDDTYASLGLPQTFVCDVSVTCIAIYQFYSAFCARGTNSWWLLFRSFAVLCFILDFTVSSFILCGMFHWVVLLLSYIVVYRREWLAIKRRKYATRS